MEPRLAGRRGFGVRGRSGRATSGPAAGPAGAAVGDVLPAGRAGGGPAGPVRADQLGPDAARPVVGLARAGGARRPGARPGARRSRRSSRRWRRGRSGWWRFSRRSTPGSRRSAWPLSPDRDPRRDGAAELRGGGPGRRPGLPPRPALARAGPGADRGGAGGVQPEPARPDAAGDADDPGPGRDARRPCSATASTCGSPGASRRTALGLGGAAFWMVLGGLALGLSLMAVGLFGLVVRAGHPAAPGLPPRRLAPGERERRGGGGSPGGTTRASRPAPRRWPWRWSLAAPWHVRMMAAHGSRRPGRRCSRRSIRIVPTGPACSTADRPGAGHAAARPVRGRPDGPPGPDRRDRRPARSSAGSSGSCGWPSRPWCRRSGRAARARPSGLFLLVPLNLLAARAIADLASRSDPGPHADLARPRDGRLDRLVDQRQPAGGGRRVCPRPGRRGHGARAAPGARPARRRGPGHPAASTAGRGAATTASGGSWAGSSASWSP